MMLCSRPFRVGVAEFGCGQCMPCRINRKRLWTLRLMLEATQHERSFFVTLTYSPKYLPVDRSVSPDHLRDYLKRLRFALRPEKVRYYAVGEYGDVRGRPHYHVCLFGPGTMRLEDVVNAWRVDGRSGQEVRGHVHVGQVSAKSAGYAASYVTKGMTNGDDSRLCGRHPEFARMSLKPGIGAGAVLSIAEALTSSRAGARFVAATGDVPRVLRVDGGFKPLGRYLSQQLRDAAGYEKPAMSFSYEAMLRELQSVLRVKGAREQRESVRVQHGHIARKRVELSLSVRKGNETV